MSEEPDKDTTVVYDWQGTPLRVDAKKLRSAVVDGTEPSPVTPPVPPPTTPQETNTPYVSANREPLTQIPPDPIKPQAVYIARPMEPEQTHLSDEAIQRHQESKNAYPEIDLSEGEYIISVVTRHPIGLIGIWAVELLITLLLIGAIFYITANSLPGISPGSIASLALALLMMIVLAFVVGVMATVVYQSNRFFLTNESVTQHIQFTLFSRKEQTISLGNIEDASFRQRGLLQSVFNYGSIRLSTEGDETTYRFNLVSDPRRQISLLNAAIEGFKNGRPVSDYTDYDEWPLPKKS